MTSVSSTTVDDNGGGGGKVTEVVDVEDSSTGAFLNDILREIASRKKQHTTASSFFRRLHFMCTIPALLISATSSILSFLASSKFVTEELHKMNIEISIGVISALSFALQSLSQGLDYASRAEGHAVASQGYARLQTKVRFDVKQHEHDDSTVQELEKSILDIQMSCKHYVPQWIVDGA